MPLIIFSFAFNPQTKEAAFSGNVKPVVALQLLQNIVISRARQEGDGSKQLSKKAAKKAVAKAKP